MAKRKKETNSSSVPPRIQQKIDIIKEFGDKMGYTVRVDQFDGYVDGKIQPIVEVELVGTHGHDGNPHNWIWNLKTGQEL